MKKIELGNKKFKKREGMLHKGKCILKMGRGCYPIMNYAVVSEKLCKTACFII